MGPEQLVFLVPISAIVLGIGAGIVKSVLASQERLLELRLRARQGANDDVVNQISALRADIAAIRDTSTQFDLALDDTLRHLAERVEHLETSSRAAPVISPAEDPLQRVGTR